ncbi:MAG: hypothetical protein M1833_005557 [Piccolia ochrophora]|nr:MAG: hypothetical protein M1833_005557 [Piccolia ochrophora]
MVSRTFAHYHLASSSNGSFPTGAARGALPGPATPIEPAAYAVGPIKSPSKRKRNKTSRVAAVPLSSPHVIPPIRPSFGRGPRQTKSASISSYDSDIPLVIVSDARKGKAAEKTVAHPDSANWGGNQSKSYREPKARKNSNRLNIEDLNTPIDSGKPTTDYKLNAKRAAKREKKRIKSMKEVRRAKHKRHVAERNLRKAGYQLPNASEPSRRDDERSAAAAPSDFPSLDEQHDRRQRTLLRYLQLRAERTLREKRRLTKTDREVLTAMGYTDLPIDTHDATAERSKGPVPHASSDTSSLTDLDATLPTTTVDDTSKASPAAAASSASTTSMPRKSTPFIRLRLSKPTPPAAINVSAANTPTTPRARATTGVSPFAHRPGRTPTFIPINAPPPGLHPTPRRARARQARQPADHDAVPDSPFPPRLPRIQSNDTLSAALTAGSSAATAAAYHPSPSLPTTWSRVENESYPSQLCTSSTMTTQARRSSNNSATITERTESLAPTQPPTTTVPPAFNAAVPVATTAASPTATAEVVDQALLERPDKRWLRRRVEADGSVRERVGGKKKKN